MKQFKNLSADGLRNYCKRHHAREYELVDVRQPGEYSKGHIAGAILLPLGELSARMSELSMDRDIIFY